MKRRNGRNQEKVRDSDGSSHAEGCGEESRFGEPLPVDFIKIVVAIVAFPGQRSIVSDLGKKRRRPGEKCRLERCGCVAREGQGPTKTKWAGESEHCGGRLRRLICRIIWRTLLVLSMHTLSDMQTFWHYK